MNILSLFDGMSCGRIAAEKAGIKVGKYFASEIKENGIKVAIDNYPDIMQLGDVTKVNGYDFIGIDLLIGGSPCQDLSIAMKNREGLEGIKSKLFFEYLRILKESKPKYFLLENVGRMSNEDKDIISDLIGVKPIRINSELLSAQLRDRLYWTNIPNIQQPNDIGISLNSILEDGWSNRGKARCLLESESRPLATPVKMFHRYYSTGFTTLIFKNERHYNECKKHYDENFKGLSAKGIDLFDGDISIYEGVRYLKKSELEELQTVPREYTKILNRNDAAGLLGDGWTVDVIAHILSYIKE